METKTVIYELRTKHGLSQDELAEKVSNSIFLFAPMNYDITSEATKEEIRNKLNVSWLKNG